MHLPLDSNGYMRHPHPAELASWTKIALPRSDDALPPISQPQRTPPASAAIESSPRRHACNVVPGSNASPRHRRVFSPPHVVLEFNASPPQRRVVSPPQPAPLEPSKKPRPRCKPAPLSPSRSQTHAVESVLPAHHVLQAPEETAAAIPVLAPATRSPDQHSAGRLDCDDSKTVEGDDVGFPPTTWLRPAADGSASPADLPLDGRLATQLAALRAFVLQRWASVPAAALALAKQDTNAIDGSNDVERSVAEARRIHVENLHGALVQEVPGCSVARLRILLGALGPPDGCTYEAEGAASDGLTRSSNLEGPISMAQFCRLHDPMRWWRDCAEHTVPSESQAVSEQSQAWGVYRLPERVLQAEVALAALESQHMHLEQYTYVERLLLGLQVGVFLAHGGVEAIEVSRRAETMTTAAPQSQEEGHADLGPVKGAAQSISSWAAENPARKTKQLEAALAHCYAAFEVGSMADVDMVASAYTSPRALRLLVGILTALDLPTHVKLSAAGLLSRAIGHRWCPIRASSTRQADPPQLSQKQRRSLAPYAASVCSRIPTPPETGTSRTNRPIGDASLESFGISNLDNQESAENFRGLLARELFTPILFFLDPMTDSLTSSRRLSARRLSAVLEKCDHVNEQDSSLIVALLSLLCQSEIPATVIGNDAQRLAPSIAAALRELHSVKASSGTAGAALSKMFSTLDRLQAGHARVSQNDGGNTTIDSLVVMFGGTRLLREHTSKLRKQQNEHCEFYAEAKARLAGLEQLVPRIVTRWRNPRNPAKELVPARVKMLAKAAVESGLDSLDMSLVDICRGASAFAAPGYRWQLRPPSPPSTAILRPRRLGALMPPDERELIKWASRQHGSLCIITAPMRRGRGSDRTARYMLQPYSLASLPHPGLLEDDGGLNWHPPSSSPDEEPQPPRFSIAHVVRRRCDTDSSMPQQHISVEDGDIAWDRQWRKNNRPVPPSGGPEHRVFCATHVGAGGRLTFYRHKGRPKEHFDRDPAEQGNLDGQK